MDKISVIVPVYRVEKYLERCIQSLLAQTYENLEIILVDDGSPDQCPAICDRYAEKYTQIRVIHKENGGLSDARNCGVNHAEGKYIGFVDSDDYIRPDMYEKLYYALKQADSEMAVCGFLRVDMNGKQLDTCAANPIKTEVVSADDFMKKLVGSDSWYYTVAWNKLYTKTLASVVNFPVGKIHEDEYTIHLFANCCKKIAIIEDQCYYYVKNPESITGTGYRKERLMGVEAMFERAIFFLENGYEELVREEEEVVYYGFKQAFMNLDWKTDAKTIKKYLRKYRKNLHKIEKVCNFSKKGKIKRYIMAYMPWLYLKLSERF